MPETVHPPAKPAPAAPIPLKINLAGGMLPLNRLLMTLQNKRMPVAAIAVDGDGDGSSITVRLDCPPETARRYATLLESLEDVERIRVNDVPGDNPEEISYDGRVFRSVENSATGEVGPKTIFRYHQSGELVWADYEGGAVRFGTLVARADEEGKLDVRYAHLNADGQLMTGECRTKPEVLPDGRLRLHESWRWTSGDRPSGESVVEETLGGA